MNSQLICPITMKIFTDPVICSDGFTYEKSAIEIWFKSNNTSPMTGLVLENKNLIPNQIVKSLICENKEKEKKQNYMFNNFINYNKDIIKIINFNNNL